MSIKRAIEVISIFRGSREWAEFSEEERAAFDLGLAVLEKHLQQEEGRKEGRHGPRCAACGSITTDHYMVRRSVWKQAMRDPKGFLHLQCLERRLNRPLTIDDFIEVPINNLLFYGYRLNVVPLLRYVTVAELKQVFSSPEAEKELLELLSNRIQEEACAEIDSQALKSMLPAEPEPKPKKKRPTKRQKKR